MALRSPQIGSGDRLGLGPRVFIFHHVLVSIGFLANLGSIHLNGEKKLCGVCDSTTDQGALRFFPPCVSVVQNRASLRFFFLFFCGGVCQSRVWKVFWLSLFPHFFLRNLGSTSFWQMCDPKPYNLKL